MNATAQRYHSAAYRMLGRSDMSRRLGQTRRAILQAIAANRLFQIAFAKF